MDRQHVGMIWVDKKCLLRPPERTQNPMFLLQHNEKYSTLYRVSHLLYEASVNRAHTEWRIVNINIVYCRHRAMSNVPSGNEEKYSFDMIEICYKYEVRFFHCCCVYTHQLYWVQLLTS